MQYLPAVSVITVETKSLTLHCLLALDHWPDVLPELSCSLAVCFHRPPAFFPKNKPHALKDNGEPKHGYPDPETEREESVVFSRLANNCRPQSWPSKSPPRVATLIPPPRNLTLTLTLTLNLNPQL